MAIALDDWIEKGRANPKEGSSKLVFLGAQRLHLHFLVRREGSRLRKRATSVYERPVSKRHWRRMYVHFDVTPSERRWWLYYCCFGVISCTQYHHASFSVTIPIRNCEFVYSMHNKCENRTNEETTTKNTSTSPALCSAPPIVINERNLSQKLGIGCDELIFLAFFPSAQVSCRYYYYIMYVCVVRATPGTRPAIMHNNIPLGYVMEVIKITEKVWTTHMLCTSIHLMCERRTFVFSIRSREKCLVRCFFFLSLFTHSARITAYCLHTPSPFFTFLMVDDGKLC